MTDIPVTPATSATPAEADSAARRVATNALSPFAAQVVTKLLMLGYLAAQFKLIGPMPAHSFADHQWETAPTRPDGDIVSAWA